MQTRSFLHPSKGTFWEVTWEGWEVETTSGKVGSAGRSVPRRLPIETDVDAWIAKAVQEKTRAGFEECPTASLALMTSEPVAPRCVDLAGLIARLAKTGTTEVAEEPAIDLGSTPRGPRRWTPEAGRRQGARLARNLEKACARAKLPVPTSLARSLATWGPIDCHESLLGMGFNSMLRLEQLWSSLDGDEPHVESYESLVRDHEEGTPSVCIDGAPAGGLAVWGAWDDRLLLAATNLGAPGEPPWLVFDPCGSGARPSAHVFPLALDFEGVLLLTLSGVCGFLTRLGQVEANHLRTWAESGEDVRPVLHLALDTAERAALALEGRHDVLVAFGEPECGSLADGAAQVLTRVAAARSALKASDR